MPRRRPRSPANPGDSTLPDAELEVLAALHEAGEADTAELRRRLAAFRPMTHASTATLLRRLEAKGLVRRRKADVGKAFVYSSVAAPAATFGGTVARLRRRLFGDDAAALASSLFADRPPRGEELRRLRELLDRLEAGEDG